MMVKMLEILFDRGRLVEVAPARSYRKQLLPK